MKESEYQKKVIDKIKSYLPGKCIALKNDANYIQGIPDWTILYENKWASLEIKKDVNARHQPNQDYYVDIMNQMSFSAFIYPENEDEVLTQLFLYFSY